MKIYTPFIKEIEYQDPWQYFIKFSNQQGALLFDGAQKLTDNSRFSFICVAPKYWLTYKNNNLKINNEPINTDIFQQLKSIINNFKIEPIAELPPFLGGIAGMFAYDFGRAIEKLPTLAQDDMQFDDLALGVYDLVISFDHKLKRAYLVSNGYGEYDEKLQQENARQRSEWLQQQLSISNIQDNGVVLSEQDIQSNFTKSNYMAAVEQVINYILAGDIFEANISQRFKAELPDGFDTRVLYHRLREFNKAPFGGYLNLGDTQILSASPERFLKLNQNNIEARPIKGTRPRSNDSIHDQLLAQELINSEKDNAENVMIVDLMRNDLSKVCCPFSINVPQLCGLESFATVHHLVSVVKGKLLEQNDSVDVLKATFPGGSITGAPKVRTMEIIDEIEPTRRGPYCGSLGYIGFDSNMDLSITIRTFAIKNNIISFQAGGAIVLDSEPLAEYQETLDKVKGLQRALLRSM